MENLVPPVRRLAVFHESVRVSNVFPCINLSKHLRAELAAILRDPVITSRTKRLTHTAKGAHLAQPATTKASDHNRTWGGGLVGGWVGAGNDIYDPLRFPFCCASLSVIMSKACFVCGSGALSNVIN